MAKQLEVRGLKELAQRMSAYPAKYAKVIAKTVHTALLVLWENVPGYPPPPSKSTYRRTGTLGRSLGTGMTGGKSGQPDIFKVQQLGQTNYKGSFGTNLKYAPKVIGDKSQQSAFFAQYWWRLESVAGKSFGKIKGLFDTATRELAKFLEGKGL